MRHLLYKTISGSHILSHGILNISSPL